MCGYRKEGGHGGGDTGRRGLDVCVVAGRRGLDVCVVTRRKGDLEEGGTGRRELDVCVVTQRRRARGNGCGCCYRCAATG